MASQKSLEPWTTNGLAFLSLGVLVVVFSWALLKGCDEEVRLRMAEISQKIEQCEKKLLDCKGGYVVTVKKEIFCIESGKLCPGQGPRIDYKDLLKVKHDPGFLAMVDSIVTPEEVARWEFLTTLYAKNLHDRQSPEIRIPEKPLATST